MTKATSSSTRPRFAVCLLIAGGLGCATLFYRGPGAEWTSTQLGGFFYVLALIFGILTAFPRWPVGWVSVGALLATCTLEFLQLWDPPLLHSLRATFVGHVVLGSTFSWMDFPWYALGAAAGLMLSKRVARTISSTHDSPGTAGSQTTR